MAPTALSLMLAPTRVVTKQGKYCNPSAVGAQLTSVAVEWGFGTCTEPLLRSCHFGIEMTPESFHIFATPEWNGDSAWRNEKGMELSAFCPEWNTNMFFRK